MCTKDKVSRAACTTSSTGSRMNNHRSCHGWRPTCRHECSPCIRCLSMLHTVRTRSHQVVLCAEGKISGRRAQISIRYVNPKEIIFVIFILFFSLKKKQVRNPINRTRFTHIPSETVGLSIFPLEGNTSAQRGLPFSMTEEYGV